MGRIFSSFFVTLIIAINIAVFLAWHGYADPEFMATNFLVSYDALLAGRWWVLITSVFSHNLFLHFLINMMVLSNFGRMIEPMLGHVTFLIFYLVAGAVSSLSHALVSAYVVHEPGMAALGASGAISGLVLLFSLIFRKEKIYLLGFIPMPALVGALVFVGLDIWGLTAQAKGGGLPIGHGAHLGGAFAGAIFYFVYVRPRMERARIAASMRGDFIA
ncbi:MAG: rhomboid family intramembrane serine protease [Bdellovibrionota bacterium]